MIWWLLLVWLGLSVVVAAAYAAGVFRVEQPQDGGDDGPDR